MSDDLRYVSSPSRLLASNPDDSSAPAARFYRAKVVEIKRRGPSSHDYSPPAVRRPAMASPRYESSPSDRVETSENANISVFPRHSTNPSRDVLNDPACDSPSQRSVSIAQGSYMDYDATVPTSTRAHFSRPHQSTPSLSSYPQRQDSRRSPPTALRTACGFQYETEEGPSAPLPLPPRRRREEHSREEYDPRRLLPTAVRPPQAFQFELEEEPVRHHSSQLNVPGRFPSSPDLMDTDEDPADSGVGGMHEHIPKLRPQAGSYRKLEPYELGMVYSNPAPYQTASGHVHRDATNAADPFIYEIRSPRKEDHDGSNRAAATSNSAAYGARNPAQEAEMYPLLRRLNAGERYSTSFRPERGGSTGRDEASVNSTNDTAMGDVRHPNGTDVRDINTERRREAERRLRR